MRFLLDENQSPLLVHLLEAAGHDVVHVRQLGMTSASDLALLALAREQRRVIMSGDTDVGELLAKSNAAAPSVVLFRRQSGRRAAELAALFGANLEAIIDHLVSGAVVVFDRDRIRVRSLPMDPG